MTDLRSTYRLASLGRTHRFCEYSLSHPRDTEQSTSYAEWFSQFLEPIGDWHLSVVAHADDMTVCATHQGANDETTADPDLDFDVLTQVAEIEKPPFYAVILYNDDYTPMDFVIIVLQQFFQLDIDQATRVMLSVHHQGQGVAGIYPRDIAETKATKVNRFSREHRHPLLCQIEPRSLD